MNKGIKYIIGLITVAIALYNSVYFQPLDKKIAESTEIEFDASAFVNGIWGNKLKTSYDEATDFISLVSQLKSDPASTFAKEAQALGIGNIGYFKVKGEGTVVKVNENNVLIRVGDMLVELETEFVFGNAVRDASGLIKINDYDETSDFNSISEAINDKIRNEVIPSFKEQVEVGYNVRFKGALELNKTHLELSQPEIIPIELEIMQ